MTKTSAQVYAVTAAAYARQTAAGEAGARRKTVWLLPRIACVVTAFIAIAATSGAQSVTLILQQDLSSQQPTGSAFTASDSAGTIYRGHLITHPARRLLRRGSMILVFDDPVVPVTKDPEGVFRAGNKVRLLKLGGSLAAAKLADDAVDGAIGATKARYVGIAAGLGLIIFQKGGEARLHRGDTIEVEPRRNASVQTALTP